MSHPANMGDTEILVMKNDLQPNYHLQKYMDKTTLTEIFKSSDNSKMQFFLNQTVQWSAENNVNLNPEKTKEMFLTLRHKSQNDLPALVIQNNEISNVEQSTILGLIVTENLTWSENTDYICKKASKRLHF